MACAEGSALLARLFPFDTHLFAGDVCVGVQPEDVGRRGQGVGGYVLDELRCCTGKGGQRARVGYVNASLPARTWPPDHHAGLRSAKGKAEWVQTAWHSQPCTQPRLFVVISGSAKLSVYNPMYGVPPYQKA